MSVRFLLVLFGIVTLIMFAVILRSKILKGSVLISLLYLIVVSALIGAGGLLGVKEWVPFSYHITFIVLTLWVLLLGILNTLLLSKSLPWGGENSFGHELKFTILIMLVGGIALLLVYEFIKFPFYVSIQLSALLMFLVPYLVYGAIRKTMKIPVKIFRMWFYPVDKHIEDPTDREMESPLVIGFEFRKNYQDNSLTTFRAKAPKEMNFGKLFYYFINDYNQRNPDEKIIYLDEKQKPQGWIFFFKPKLFRKVRYVDPEETNSFNFIKENSVIVCKRVIEI